MQQCNVYRGRVAEINQKLPEVKQNLASLCFLLLNPFSQGADPVLFQAVFNQLRIHGVNIELIGRKTLRRYRCSVRPLN